MKIDYNNRKFRPLSNSENGEISHDMIFHYKHKNDIITCSYNGRNIINGHLIGTVKQNGIINMVYHQINAQGCIMTGKCTSTPELMPNGKIKLHEEWQWTNGDQSKGHSILEEI